MSAISANHGKSRFWLAFWEGLSGVGLYCLAARCVRAPANDLAALPSDWEKIGEDLHAAIQKIRSTHPAI